MIILSRTGNAFRQLSKEEYRAERLKDGNFTEIEMQYFEQVTPYCANHQTAALFSPAWR